jgi:hypothetical protein
MGIDNGSTDAGPTQAEPGGVDPMGAEPVAWIRWGRSRFRALGR